MSRPNSSSRVFGLDLLRATAIALVLLGHVMLLFRFVLRPMTGWGILAGYFGVEIFFVLSGFLIGGILIRDFQNDGATAGTLGRFWCRRWLRTLPLYYLFIGINLLIDHSLGAPTATWWRHALFIQNFNGPAGRFFSEAWSLAVEEWFYLLAPILIIALTKTGLPVKRAVLFAAVAGILAASGWRMHVVATSHPDWLRGLRSVVTLRLDACMFGVLAAWWSHYAPASWNAWSRTKLVAGLFCLGGAGVMFRVLPVNDSFVAGTHLFTLTSVGAMLCLPACAALRTAQGKFSAAVTHVSKWSYAMYLLNFPIFMWLTRESGLGLVEPLTASIAAVTALFFTIFSSAVLHYLYEAPILRWRDRHVRSAAQVISGAGAERAVALAKTADLLATAKSA